MNISLFNGVFTLLNAGSLMVVVGFYLCFYKCLELFVIRVIYDASGSSLISASISSLLGCCSGSSGYRSNSSRSTLTSAGASIPKRTLSPLTFTIVNVIESPSLIFSQTLRDSTSIFLMPPIFMNNIFGLYRGSKRKGKERERSNEHINIMQLSLFGDNASRSLERPEILCFPFPCFRWFKRCKCLHRNRLCLGKE